MHFKSKASDKKGKRVFATEVIKIQQIGSGPFGRKAASRAMTSFCGESEVFIASLSWHWNLPGLFNYELDQFHRRIDAALTVNTKTEESRFGQSSSYGSYHETVIQPCRRQPSRYRSSGGLQLCRPSPARAIRNERQL